MRHRNTLAALLAGATVALTACGATTAARSAPTAPPRAPATVTAPSLNAATLAQVDSDLDAVHNDLTQATTDLADPKPDS